MAQGPRIWGAGTAHAKIDRCSGTDPFICLGELKQGKTVGGNGLKEIDYFRVVICMVAEPGRSTSYTPLTPLTPLPPYPPPPGVRGG